VMDYIYTAKAMFGANTTAPSCSYLACGINAGCVMDAAGARCQCNPCFVGDGFRCRNVPCTADGTAGMATIPGVEPATNTISPSEAPVEAAEISVATWGQDRIAVFVREVSNDNRGVLVLGKAVGAEVTWGQRQLVDPSLATFGPVLVASPGGRLTLGFRDAAKDGVGYLLGGHVNTMGNELQAVLSAPQQIAQAQEHRMVLVQLQSSRVVCLYAETHKTQAGRLTAAFGGAALAEVVSGGPLRILGKYRFEEGLVVSDLAAVALTPSSIVVGYKAKNRQKVSSGEPSRELSAVWLGMDGAELVIDPHPIALEPERSGMQARDLSLVAKDTIVYTYIGASKVIKASVIHVDPHSHQMTILDDAHELEQGTAQYLHSVSLASSGQIPATFTIFQKDKEPCGAKACRISAKGRIADCRAVAWRTNQELLDISAGRLMDGRFAVAYVDTQGSVMFQLLGAQDHGAMLDFGE